MSLTELLPDPPARFAEVALNLPLRRTVTYAIPPDSGARAGSRVLVPFRGDVRPGIVVATSARSELPAAKLRSIARVLDPELVLPPALLALAERIAADYGCGLGEALDAMLPAVAKRRGGRRIPCLELAVAPEQARAAIDELEERAQPRARLLRAVLEYGGPMPVRAAERRSGTSDSPWRTLIRSGLLRRKLVAEQLEPFALPPAAAEPPPELNDDQRRAVAAIGAAVQAASHAVFLLHGVTGSGKTEVYLRVLEQVRALGRSGIVLVPEIALTPQTVGRFAARFPDVAVLHSGLTDAERGRHWRRLVEGRATIAIGARSALFAPVRDLGLIVVDEEQEASFKQESTPRYHAREAAITRASIERAVVILGSATPTLESYGRARRGAYELVTLPRRAGKGTLPRVLVEDLRRAGKEDRIDGLLLTRRLRNLIDERLAARDQVILLQNRRGYAPALICPRCGTAVQCRRCSVAMAWHARRARLICHWCHEEQRRPELCGTCRHPRLHELGAGTERVTAVVQKLFPSAIVARMDADTMAERGAHERVLDAFRRRQIDVLVGTQMVAKGHDFPDVTLVGVVSADTGLFLPDFRAAERTFQLLYQVAGRAGRADKPGTVLLQTLCPENYAIAAAAALDYEGFVEQELKFRRAASYPPFCRLIRILLEARDEVRLRRELDAIAKCLPARSDLHLLGPAPAVIPKVKDRSRWHLLLKCVTAESFTAALAAAGTVEERGDARLRVTLDVDPVHLL
jgi:primosomal protein N' (replication factor Y)